MTNQELQQLVEQISIEQFGQPFEHKTRFNKRLRTTGGRYLLATHDIEINPLMLSAPMSINGTYFSKHSF